MSLRFEDVDVTACRLWIRRADWDRPGTKGRRDACGRSRKQRFVNVPCQLSSSLAWRTTGWIFPSPKNPTRPVTARTVRRWLRRDTDGRVLFHDLRHAYATKLWEYSQQIPLVQLNLGHAKSTTTAVYLHLPRDYYDGSFLDLEDTRD